jgi:hypothetical protein
MRIRLEGAHAFCMSTFGGVERLRADIRSFCLDSQEWSSGRPWSGSLSQLLAAPRSGSPSSIEAELLATLPDHVIEQLG